MAKTQFPSYFQASMQGALNCNCQKQKAKPPTVAPQQFFTSKYPTNEREMQRPQISGGPPQDLSRSARRFQVRWCSSVSTRFGCLSGERQGMATVGAGAAQWGAWDIVWLVPMLWRVVRIGQVLEPGFDGNDRKL